MPRRDLCQVRRGTAANWTAVNPILASGEAGYETDTGQLKYGNGTAVWSALPYFSTGTGNGGTLPANVTLLGNPVTETEFDYLSGTTDFIQTQLNAKAASADLAGKANIVHTHEISDVNGLQTVLDSKSGSLLNGLPSANLTANGVQTNTFAAGATITAGECVRLGSNGKWLQTDADAIATSTGLLGLALESKNDGEPMLTALPGAFVRVDSWNWTAGATVYLSATPGVLTETQPTGTDDVIRVAGFVITPDIIWFDPSPDYVTHI